MQLGFVCVHDVQNLDATRSKVIRNQPAMTTPPDRLRAHDRSRPGFATEIDKSSHTFSKFFCLHVIGVRALSFIAPGSIGRILPPLSSATKLWKTFSADNDYA